ncbi:hypothetical protein BRD00_02690 [Halobacteriales archaeon QS_8_69_26]|nr:MAG: hypothetical protein BRD00_02690 [Halobacteriales archaeon QS_8_69_26]
MYRTLGPVGLLGVLVMVAGIGIISWRDPYIGGGLALVLAGIGIVVQRMITKVMGMFGMGL